MTKDQLVAAHRLSSNHRTQLEESNWVGCFYCIQIYSPRDIVEWIDFDQTALCPRCGIDSCIGSASGFNVNKEFLDEMNVFWFNTVRVLDMAAMNQAFKKVKND